MAVPERTQLLQRLAALDGRGRETRKAAQEAGAVAVEADVAQRGSSTCAALPLSVHTAHISTAPSTAPLLLPLPPTISMLQI